MAAVNDSYIEPTALVWNFVQIFGTPFQQNGSFVENLIFTFNPAIFGTPFQQNGSFYGIEKIPSADTIKAGVNYGYNDSLIGTFSISTEQWS